MKHFQTLGQFAVAVHSASRPSAKLDPRLVANAPTTYGSEGVGEDGGFAVPPDFADEIFEAVKSESLMEQVDVLETSSNTATIPMDSTAPWVTRKGRGNGRTSRSHRCQPSSPSFQAVWRFSTKMGLLLCISSSCER